MSRLRLLALLQVIVFLLLAPGVGYGMEAGKADQTLAKEKLEKLIESSQQGAEHSSGNLPQLQLPFVPSAVVLNEENQAMQQKAIKTYFQHEMESNRHQLNVFHWQLLSAKIIFIVVILLLVAGIYFAAVQFHHGLRSGKPVEQSSEFEASLKGIKVSSPVLGVIILTISLAFFYLYLVYVYPIEFVRG